MLDNFREWVSDNLRYILLGLAVLVVLIVLIFSVRAFGGDSSGKEKKAPEKKTEQKQDSADSEKSEKKKADKEAANTLEKNAYPEVNTLIEAFYTAWGESDVARMKELTDSFSTEDEENIASTDYIEKYSDVEVYTKRGLDKDSFVVYVSYKMKFKDIETAAPGLSELYVMKDEKGKFLIHNDDSNAEIQECIEKTRQEKDVKKLISRVEKKLNEAMESDKKLKDFEGQL